MSTKYCTFCGTSLPAGARFCGECGRPVQAVNATSPMATSQEAKPGETTSAPAEPVAPPALAEPILGIVPLVQRQKGFLGLKYETFSLIITPQRLLFPLVTNQMTKEAIAQARQEAKSQGRGFLGQFAAQMGWVGVLTQHYLEMSPDDILGQPAGGFFLPSAEVTSAWLEEEEDEDTGTEIKLFIETIKSKHDFVVKGMSTRDARSVLQTALGSRAR